MDHPSVSAEPPIRASDADRDRTIALLRDHAVEGRLTFEEFTDRMTATSLARTSVELEELARDLPSPQGSVARRRRRPTRLLFSMFSSTEREGRLRIPRWVAGMTMLGNIDLDLRQATLEGEVITIFALGIFGTFDVYVPEGVEVDLHGFALGGHKRVNGNDPPPQPGTPLVRVFAVSIFAGMDVWRVPIAWTQKTWREVIKGIRAGAHKELEA